MIIVRYADDFIGQVAGELDAPRVTWNILSLS
jgi:hypothetical protein